MEKLSLGSHYTYKKILRQCLSPILMMIFISIYTIVDGTFIANFDSQEGFAGVNLIFPIIMLVGGLGFMFGCGGSAFVGKLLGEQKREKANQVFTMMIMSTGILSLVASLIVFPFIDEIVVAMAKISVESTQEMIDKAIIYGRILVLGQAFFSISNIFQNFFVVDEKPKLGFLFTLSGGVTNVIFDALFIAVFKWGVVGAAIATILGYIVSSLGPILYFLKHKNDTITLTKTKFDFPIIFKCIGNGLSDFIFNVSSSIIGVVFNIQALRYIGEQGVIAYGVIMYLSFIFLAVFIGLDLGMAPIISYNYGAQNRKELRSVVKKVMIVFFASSVCMILGGLLLSRPLSQLFCKEPELIDLCAKALIIYNSAYLFAGFCFFITSMFTALNNGLVSGILSFLRLLVLQILFAFILPVIFGADGLWWSFAASEFVSMFISFIFLVKNKKKYFDDIPKIESAVETK